MEAGPALLSLAATSATHAEQIELLDSGVAGLEASMQTKVEEETFGAAVATLGAAVATKAAQSDLDATNAAVATKAAQSDLDATNAAVATKAAQSDLDATNAAVAAKAAQADLDVTNAAVATKAEQAALDVESERLDQAAAQAASNVMNIQVLQNAASSLFESVATLDTRVTANAAGITSTQSVLNSTDQLEHSLAPLGFGFPSPLSLWPPVGKNGS
jgi:hypothetical protein